MPISGKFEADFGDFVDETAKGVAALDRFADAAGAVEPPVAGMHDALASFDSALGVMGVHIGPEIRGLTELGAASGQTASQLGAVATAGFVVAAGIGGWKIGRAVAEFFSLDTAIGNATAKLLGFGDVAAQAAGANADALARASALVGFEVKNMTDALVINGAALGPWRSQATISATAVQAWSEQLRKVGGDLPQLTADLKSQNFELKDLAARYHVSVEALQFFERAQKNAAAAVEKANAIIQASNAQKLHATAQEISAHKEAAAAAQTHADAMAELNSAGDGWKGTLDTIDGAVVEAIKYYLAAGVSQGALAEAYGLTAAQVRAVASAIKEATVATQAHTPAAIECANASMRYAATIREQHEAVMGIRLSFQGWHDDVLNVNRALDGTILNTKELIKEQQRLHDLGSSQTYDLSTAEGQKQFLDANPMASITASLEYFFSHTLQQAIQSGLVTLDSRVQNRLPHAAEGGTVMVGERGPEVVRLPFGSTVFPTGSGGGGVVNHFYVNGTAEESARKIGAILMRQAGTSRQWGSA